MDPTNIVHMTTNGDNGYIILIAVVILYFIGYFIYSTMVKPVLKRMWDEL